MSPAKFEFKPGIREQVPLLVGLMGPSGGGKTFSALRLATGMQRVGGGKIYVIDTEARRSLHYADDFDFEFLEFGEPFSPLEYLSRIQAAVDAGAGTIIVDSISHEHEGPGGVLEWHDKEVKRLGEHMTFPAWAKPKAARRRLIGTILTLKVNTIFCFRAKEKSEMGEDKNGKKTIDKLGWMAIAGDEFVYELTTSILLPPNAQGVPDWTAELPGERAMIKRPKQFHELLRERRPLDEDHGEAMARWAAGAPPGPYRFTQGDHKGKDVTEVAVDYLTQIVEHPDTSAKLKKIAGDEIGRRIKAEAS